MHSDPVNPPLSVPPLRPAPGFRVFETGFSWFSKVFCRHVANALFYVTRAIPSVRKASFGCQPERVLQHDGLFPPRPYGNDGKGNSQVVLNGLQVSSSR